MRKNSSFSPYRKIRDLVFLIRAFIFSWLYIPHLTIYTIKKYLFHEKAMGYLDKDVEVNSQLLDIYLPPIVRLLYLLHNNSYFRSLFYYRIGYVYASLIGWYRPGDKYFIISKTLEMRGGVLLVHPFSTIINADFIGENFHINACSIIGSKMSKDDRPVIGNNVHQGASVTIIGAIKIGDNVTIGAGSVVVKDIPNNCIIAGNPAKIIRYIN